MRFDDEITARLQVRPSMTLEERITRYLELCPGAISGEGGHNATFHIACVLVHGFDLPASQALDFLRWYNQKCQPPWSEKELRHKIEDASKAAHDKPRGYLLKARNLPLPRGRYGTELPRPELLISTEPMPPRWHACRVLRIAPPGPADTQTTSSTPNA